MTTESSIFSTLSYFDIFSFPLTREEIFQYLWRGAGVSESEVERVLVELVSNGLLINKNGYYFFPGKEESVVSRMRSVVPTEKKLNRARLAVKFISWLPFLRAVYVCNSVAAETAKAGSDIDLFIVTAEGRLWLVRFMTNAVLKMLGLRTGRQSANKICLSFYVGEDHLDLGPWRISNDDIYLTYWLMQLLPIYDPRNILEKIHRANSWTKDFVELAYSISAKSINSLFKYILERLLGRKLGNILESIAKNIQWKFLREEVKVKAASSTGDVVIGDGILKLHEHDARREFYEKWQKNILSYVK